MVTGMSRCCFCHCSKLQWKIGLQLFAEASGDDPNIPAIFPKPCRYVLVIMVAQNIVFFFVLLLFLVVICVAALNWKRYWDHCSYLDPKNTPVGLWQWMFPNSTRANLSRNNLTRSPNCLEVKWKHSGMFLSVFCIRFRIQAIWKTGKSNTNRHQKSRDLNVYVKNEPSGLSMNCLLFVCFLCRWDGIGVDWHVLYPKTFSKKFWLRINSKKLWNLWKRRWNGLKTVMLRTRKSVSGTPSRNATMFLMIIVVC